MRPHSLMAHDHWVSCGYLVEVLCAIDSLTQKFQYGEMQRLYHIIFSKIKETRKKISNVNISKATIKNNVDKKKLKKTRSRFLFSTLFCLSIFLFSRVLLSKFGRLRFVFEQYTTTTIQLYAGSTYTLLDLPHSDIACRK